MTGLREWQAELFDRWANEGYYGLVTARTGSGKTRAGVSALSKYHQMYPFSKILVIVPSQKIGAQWIDEMKLQNVPLDEVPVMSYTQAINKMYRGGLKADCLILDECHRVSPEKQSSQVMKLNPIHVLGLSATPEGAVKILGKPFYVVDWDEAELCPFYVHYTRFTPSPTESERYDRLSNAMRRKAMEVTGNKAVALPPRRNNGYDILVRKRRDTCYTFPSRIAHTVNLVKAYAGKRRMVVFTERNEQIKEIGAELDKNGIRYSVCSQFKDTLSEFEAHRTNILLLCKKLREGWNDPSLEMEILCACTTRELQHTQVVGRVQRKDPNNPDKIAHVFVLVAEGTSDEQVIKNNDFPKDRVEATSIRKVLDVCPGLSDRQLVNGWF